MDEEQMIEYRIEVVGGPFDMARVGRWRDDGEHPPPETILLGTCQGKAKRLCGRECRAPHAFYWLPDEVKRPPRTVPYALENSYIEPHADEVRLIPGKAIYTIGGLGLPAAPVERELVATGHESKLTASGAISYRDAELVLDSGRRCPCVLIPTFEEEL